MAKNKQSNLIANIKTLNVGFINKYTVNSGMGGRSYSVSDLFTNHFSQIFLLLSLPNYFSV